MFVLCWCGVCCEWVIELGTAHKGESLPCCVCIGKCEQAVWDSDVFQGGKDLGERVWSLLVLWSVHCILVPGPSRARYFLRDMLLLTTTAPEHSSSRATFSAGRAWLEAGCIDDCSRRARLLDRMSLFWRAFVSVVQYAFVPWLPYCRSDWMTDKSSSTAVLLLVWVNFQHVSECQSLAVLREMYFWCKA